MNTDPLEEIVRYFFAYALGREAVGSDDDFFELGGYSLLMFRLVGSLEDALGFEVPLRIVFESPTPALFTERLREESRDHNVDLDRVLTAWSELDS